MKRNSRNIMLKFKVPAEFELLYKVVLEKSGSYGSYSTSNDKTGMALVGEFVYLMFSGKERGMQIHHPENKCAVLLGKDRSYGDVQIFLYPTINTKALRATSPEYKTIVALMNL